MSSPSRNRIGAIHPNGGASPWLACSNPLTDGVVAAMHTHIPSAVADASTVAATASVLELLGQHLDRRGAFFGLVPVAPPSDTQRAFQAHPSR
jgi:hypothetical protein